RDRAGCGVSAMAVPAHDAGRSIGKEPEADGPVLARDRGVCAAGGLGLLDRPEPSAFLSDTRAARGADRRARAAGLLRAASFAEPADESDGGTAVGNLRRVARV